MAVKQPPLLVIVGETASGKSALALDLAQRLNSEIICADSATIRREATIGTAKPTKAERDAVPHHLLDIIGPNETFTASRFKDLANAAIADITYRDKLPIMVGGTGLYIDGLLYDYGFLPEGISTIERKLLNELSADQLLERLAKAGIALGDVDRANRRRLIRLLETNGRQPERKDLRSNTLVIGLVLDRELLRERITMRVDAMLNAGLEEEVKELSKAYGWECEALKAIGYREWEAYFSGQQSLDETRSMIIGSTADLAKRQRTWFKRNKSIHWFKTPVNVTTIVDLVTTQLNK